MPSVKQKPKTKGYDQRGQYIKCYCPKCGKRFKKYFSDLNQWTGRGTRPCYCERCEIIKKSYDENDPLAISKNLCYHHEDDELKRLVHDFNNSDGRKVR